MFLLVPAYPGCPGSKAVKRSLLLLLLSGSAFVACITEQFTEVELKVLATKMAVDFYDPIQRR